MTSCAPRQRCRCPALPRARTHLLFEVPPVFFVDEDEVEVVPDAKLFVDVAVSRRELETAEEESYRYRFTCE